MAYQRQVEQSRWFIKLIATALGGAFVVILALLMLLWQGRQSVKVDVRPGITAPVSTTQGTMPAENVFNFSLVVFQQLNRWRENGADDYPAQISRVRAFLTDRYRGQLAVDAQSRSTRGELQHRTRSISLPPEINYTKDRVTQVSPSSWIVTLDLELQESVRGQVIKNTIIRYPLRVVARDVDPQFNPYGLLLDGYQEDPIRLSDEELLKLNIVRK